MAPYLVEKRNIIKEICKEHNIEIKDVAPIDLSHRIHWLSGYFDAEGHYHGPADHIIKVNGEEHDLYEYAKAHDIELPGSKKHKKAKQIRQIRKQQKKQNKADKS